MPKQHPDHKDPLPEELESSSGTHRKKKYPKHIKITIHRYGWTPYPTFYVDCTDFGLWMALSKINNEARGDFYKFYKLFCDLDPKYKDIPVRFPHEEPDPEVLTRLVSEGLVILEN